LREVDDDRFAVTAPNEDVEFVEVTVYEPRMREPDDEVHQLRVEFTRRRHLVDLTPLRPCYISGEHALIDVNFHPQRVSIDKLHQNAMSSLVNWPWDWELMLM
jgi:hypothetical protein